MTARIDQFSSPADTRVLPGHGPETTIAAAEKKFDSWVSAGQVITSSSGD